MTPETPFSSSRVVISEQAYPYAPEIIIGRERYIAQLKQPFNNTVLNRNNIFTYDQVIALPDSIWNSLDISTKERIQNENNRIAKDIAIGVEGHFIATIFAIHPNDREPISANAEKARAQTVDNYVHMLNQEKTGLLLNEKELIIVKRSFGITNGVAETNKEIGSSMKISEYAVGERRKQALKKLRNPHNIHELIPFVPYTIDSFAREYFFLTCDYDLDLIDPKLLDITIADLKLSQNTQHQLSHIAITKDRRLTEVMSTPTQTLKQLGEDAQFELTTAIKILLHKSST